MDAELKAKWVAALRSGEYKQTTGKLKKDDAYCCLGVLCVVRGATWTDIHVETDDYDEFRSYGNVPVFNGEMLSRGEDEELNSRFMREIGMPDDEMPNLVIMNDGDEKNGKRQHTFPEIADYIEKNL